MERRGQMAEVLQTWGMVIGNLSAWEDAVPLTVRNIRVKAREKWKVDALILRICNRLVETIDKMGQVVKEKWEVRKRQQMWQLFVNFGSEGKEFMRQILRVFTVWWTGEIELICRWKGKMKGRPKIENEREGGKWWSKVIVSEVLVEERIWTVSVTIICRHKRWRISVST